MPRPRTHETVMQEVIELIYERRKKCYTGGVLTGSCINQPEWVSITDKIVALNAEAAALKT